MKEIANELGIPADRMVYAGDTGTDMKAAVGSGMFPVGVSWGFQSVDKLKEYGAELIINHPSEMVVYIKKSCSSNKQKM